MCRLAAVAATSVAAIVMIAKAAATPHGGDTSACPAAASDGNSSSPADVEMLVLAMQWPFSTCVGLASKAGTSCLSPPAAFVVHGLWGIHATGPRSSCCRDNLRGTESALGELTPIGDFAPQLQRMWPDLTARESAIEMWNREWQQYGSCSGLSMRQYFRKALELSRRFDILRALYAEHIFASSRRNAELYSFERVQHAVDSVAGGSRVRIRCQRERAAGNDSVVLLDEVLVCLDKHGTRTVDCPSTCLAIEDGAECCRSGERIRVPFWSHEKRHHDGAVSGGSGHPSPMASPSSISSNSSLSPNKKDNVAVDPVAGSVAGQLIGICVLAAGVGFYLFKQFFDQRRPVTAFVDYQRIP
jgi:ribonuclease I